MKNIAASLDFRSQRDRSVLLEVAVQKEPVLFGVWTYEVRLGQQVLQPAGKWTLTCEHKEKGCEYVEIDLPLSHDYRLQRSLLIDYKDKVLLLCDVVLADEESRATNKTLSYQTKIYVSSKLHAKSGKDGTEIEFKPHGKTSVPAFRALPLALPEWKESNLGGIVSGTFTEAEGTLTLRQETAGKSLCVPLFFDLDTERLGKRYTWRQLTVGENLHRVPEDQAVGYRIHLDQQQFLLYRSLTSTGNRTLLGHNLVDDFCFARFDPESGVEPLIAVEVVE